MLALPALVGKRKTNEYVLNMGRLMNKLLVVDTETGGLNSDIHSIFSLGAVVIEDAKILPDGFEVFIAEPDMRYTQQALDINRIDIEWLKANGMKPQEALNRFAAFINLRYRRTGTDDKAILVGQNLPFDIGFIKRLLRLVVGARYVDYYYDQMFSHRTIDTAGLLRFLGYAGVLPSESGGLDEAIEFFDIDVSEDKVHTALGDARRTAKVLLATREYIRTTSARCSIKDFLR